MLSLFLFFTSWAALTVAQVLPSAYNLTSVLSGQDQLSNFTSYLSLYPALLSQAESGNVTILAPSDEAFAKFLNSSDAVTNDTDKLGAILSYHILLGSYTRAQFKNEPLFIPTLLTDPRYANVTGGQRVEAAPLDGEIVFYSAIKAVSHFVTQDILYAGNASGVIHIIDSLLALPIAEPDTVSDAKLEGFIAILVETPPDPKVLGIIGPLSDWTLFAPNSTTFDVKNAPESAIFAYEEYHFVHGEVAYSTQLTDGKKMKTLQGGEVTISVVNGTTYVNDVKVVDPDYLISTGVIHLIERNLNYNDTLARPNSTNSSAPTSTSTPGAASSSSGLSTGAKAGIGVGAAVGVLVLIGIVWFCLRSRRASGSPQAYSGPPPTELRSGQNQFPSELPQDKKGGAWELPAEQGPRQLYELGDHR